MKKLGMAFLLYGVLGLNMQLHPSAYANEQLILTGKHVLDWQQVSQDKVGEVDCRIYTLKGSPAKDKNTPSLTVMSAPVHKAQSMKALQADALQSIRSNYTNYWVQVVRQRPDELMYELHPLDDPKSGSRYILSRVIHQSGSPQMHMLVLTMPSKQHYENSMALLSGAKVVHLLPRHHRRAAQHS